MNYSSLDKDNIIAFLANAYSKNTLSISEYEHRVDMINKIQTKEELYNLVNDLVINPQEITEEETINIKMENRTFSRSTLVTKKFTLFIKCSTILLDYLDIDFPDGKYEIQLNGDLANITIKLPIQYKYDNQLSSQMVTINEIENNNIQKWERNVTIKITGKLKKSEIKIVRI
jgi:hypothetical protein